MRGIIGVATPEYQIYMLAAVPAALASTCLTTLCAITYIGDENLTSIF